MIFDNNELLEVAYVVKPHGLNGFISIKVIEGFSKNNFSENTPVFLLIEGIPVPFFIEAVKQVSSNIALKLKHIDNSEKALRFKSCSIYMIIDEQLQEESEEAVFELMGYHVYDEKFGHIGEITGFNSIPGNPVFETTLDGKTIIIPYIEEFIKEINDNEQSVKISAPDGLIDLYI